MDRVCVPTFVDIMEAVVRVIKTGLCAALKLITHYPGLDVVAGDGTKPCHQ